MLKRLRSALVLAAGLLAGVAQAEPSPERSKPDVLLVTFDTTRADRIGAKRHQRAVTPQLDRLRREATEFVNCVSPIGTTTPSHASMFTGLYPREHGVLTNVEVLPLEMSTLAERLRGAGYRTGGFAGLTSMLAASGFDRGFEVSSVGPEAVRGANDTNLAAIGWLLALRDERAALRKSNRQAVASPFFAWFHYYDPHSPYDENAWSEPMLRKYSGEFGRAVSVARFGLGKWMSSQEDTLAVRTLYDGQLNAADAAFGKLLKLIESLRLLDNVVVIVAGDHGQSLGDHEHPGHRILWESILRVPLIVWDSRAPTARRVKERVGLVDLMPTVLELAGLELPTGLQGRSLTSALAGRPLEQRPYFGQVKTDESSVRENSEMRWVRKHHVAAFEYEAAVYEGQWKLLVGPAGSALYNVEKDPGELSPIAREDEPAAYERLGSLLTDFRSSKRELPKPVRVPDATIEQLRELGYAE